MRKRGRPAIGPGLGFCCPPEIVSAIDQQAEQERTSRAEVVRRIFMIGWELSEQFGYQSPFEPRIRV